MSIFKRIKKTFQLLSDNGDLLEIIIKERKAQEQKIILENENKRINNENNLKKIRLADDKLTEGLILQLHKKHPGRNDWLVKYGKSREASNLRDELVNRNI